MTKDQITAWAREAGFVIDEESRKYQPKCIGFTHYLIDDELSRFAALAYAAGAAAEREAICKLGEDSRYSHQYVHSFLNTIRARGNT